MFLVRLHLVVTIVLTELAGLCSEQLPYFPIEVSRAVATDSAAPVILFYGAVSCILPLLY